ncbi:MAG TPA: hypothetical protein VER32_16460 [Pyrinomonadaceae bacterium]|nr:hypothetical protein [Pyrinomonadaceae bacterium]
MNMNTLKRKIRLLPVVALALVVAGGVAALAQRQIASGGSQGRPEVKIALSGAVERGEEAVPLDRVESVQPGEVLRWSLTSVNVGTGAAREYKAVGDIPTGTAFIADSAVAEKGSTVTYSIDGGKTFSTQPIIEERQADGTVRQKPAPVSMYTQVRYEWKDELASGGRLGASYKVRVK